MKIVYTILFAFCTFLAGATEHYWDFRSPQRYVAPTKHSIIDFKTGKYKPYAPTNYHVASDGGTGAGTLAQPWSYAYFLTKHSTRLPGDSILFRNGDVFPVTTKLVGRAGLKYGTYGDGLKARIRGLQIVSAWSYSGITGVYYATLTYDPNFIMVDDVQTGKGTFPKGAYNYKSYESFTKNTTTGIATITDNQLPSSPSWQGATAVIRTDGQRWQKLLVTAQSGGTLTLGTGSAGENYFATHGYFFQNHMNCLTTSINPDVATGDYMYNGVTDRLYVYFADNNPNAHTIQVPLATEVIQLPSTATGVTISGLCIEGSNTAGIAVSGTTNNNKILNCEVRYNYNGIDASGGSDRITISGNYVHDNTNKGIAGPINPTNYLIEENRVVKSGMIIGAGGSGPSTYSGIYFEGGTGFTVRRNYVDSVGAIGIRCFRGKDILVEENVIKNFGFLKSDNGGIMAYADAGDSSLTRFTNRIVRRNIIVNSRTEGGIGAPTQPAAQSGLYWDSRSHNTKFIENIVANNAGYGLEVLSSTRNITAYGNIFFKNSNSATIMTGSVRGLLDSGNVTVTATGVNAVEYRNSSLQDYSSYGLTALNIFRTGTAAAFYTTGTSGGAKTLAQFQSAYLLEAGSTRAALDGTETLYYNEHTTDTTFIFEGSQYRDVKTGTLYTGSRTFAPFTGAVMVLNATVTDNTSPTPGTLSITGYTQTTISASATAATDVSNPITYKWYISTNTYASPSAVEAGATLVSSGSALTQTFNGLSNATNYKIYLIARDLATTPNEALYNVVNQTTLPASPAVPSAPTIGTVTSTTIELTITASTNSTSYNLYQSIDGGAYTLIRTSLSAGLTTINATPGHTYTFKVSGVNLSGESALSAASSNAVTPPDATKPDAPTSVTATNTTTSSTTIVWGAVSGATSYTIYYSTSPTTGFVSATTSGTSYDLSGLTAGIPYYVQVSATNGTGEGARSAVVSFSTTAYTLRMKKGKVR